MSGSSWRDDAVALLPASLEPQVLESALVADLRLVMRGPGAQRGQGMSMIGPALRAMCGIAANDRPGDAVMAVAAWLQVRSRPWSRSSFAGVAQSRSVCTRPRGFRFVRRG